MSVVRNHIPKSNARLRALFRRHQPDSKKERGCRDSARINLQTADIFHASADIARPDSLQLAREATLVDEPDHHPVRRAFSWPRPRKKTASNGKDRADPTGKAGCSLSDFHHRL